MGRIIAIIALTGLILGLGAVTIEHFSSVNNGSLSGVKKFSKSYVENYIMDNYGWNPEIRFKHILHKRNGLWVVSGLLKVDDGYGHIEEGKFKIEVQFDGQETKSWGTYEQFRLTKEAKIGIENFESLVQYEENI